MTATTLDEISEETLADLMQEGLFVDGDWVESKDQDPNGEVRLIQLADIGDGVFRNRSSRFLTLTTAKELRCTFLEPGDVLVARMPEPLGRACIFPGVGQPAVTAVDVCILRPKPTKARPEWLVKAINSPNFRASMQHLVRGTTRQRISRKNLGTLSLAVPAVDEQVRIAEAVERLDLKRSSSSSHLDVAHHAIERFRRAVLAAAYHDASTWDDGETEVPLPSLLREPFKNGYSARAVGHQTPFRVLTLTATTSGWFDPRQFKYTDEEFSPDSPFWLEPGDILIQRGNTAEYVGVPAIYEGGPDEFLYPDLMIRARTRADVSPRYVWYMLLAPQARNFLRDRATGSAGNMPKINQAVLRELPIPLPPETVRDLLVKKLDSAFALADAVTLRLDAAIGRVDRSSKAVLAKAFRGELSTAGNEPAVRTAGLGVPR